MAWIEMFNFDNLDFNKKIYYMNQEVILIKIFIYFNLAKIKYLNTDIIITVDSNALSNKPDMTNTLSLGVLGG